jgi:flagellar basal body-associated protein FliL
VTWPNAIIILGVIVLVIILVGGAFSTFLELRKAKLVAATEDSLRQLVSRYEQLAENTQDAQQRVATDLAELRTRTAAIEQILRTVE